MLPDQREHELLVGRGIDLTGQNVEGRRDDHRDRATHRGSLTQPPRRGRQGSGTAEQVALTDLGALGERVVSMLGRLHTLGDDDCAGALRLGMDEGEHTGHLLVRRRLDDLAGDLEDVGRDERQHGHGRRLGPDIVEADPGDTGPLPLDAVQQRGRVPVQRPLGHLEYHPEPLEGALDVRPQILGAVRVEGDRLNIQEENIVDIEI
jgi:hypothetical protein